MKDMRKRYQPIINALQARIDEASHDWVTKGDERALHEYNMLITEICEIKTAIKEHEKTQ